MMDEECVILSSTRPSYAPYPSPPHTIPLPQVKAPTEVTCVVMDNKYLTPAEFKRCENLPNKKQLLATIARMIKQPAQKIAVGISGVPRKLAYGVKALSELDDDKSKVVGDVAKPKSA